jgi:hypothetical protein
MKAKPTRRKPPAKLRKYYTFNVTCSFTTQNSFLESEVVQESEGAEGDKIPTAKALRDLAKRLTEALGSRFSVDDLEVYADSDQLLGVDEGP